MDHVPELQHLEFSISANNVQPAGGEVTLYTSLGIPYRKHFGSPRTGYVLRANPAFGEAERPAFSDVAVNGADGQIWFAKVLAFFAFRGPAGQLGDKAYVVTKDGRVGLAAYVQWYTQVDNTEQTKHLGMVRLKKSRHQRQLADGGIKTTDWTDIIPVKDIIRPVLLQRDPTVKGHKRARYFYNQFVV